MPYRRIKSVSIVAAILLLVVIGTAVTLSIHYTLQGFISKVKRASFRPNVVKIEAAKAVVYRGAGTFIGLWVRNVDGLTSDLKTLERRGIVVYV